MNRAFLICLAVVLGLSSLVCPATRGHGATYTLNPGDSIQTAINEASTGDVIELTDGTYTGSGTRNIDFGGKAITVRSQSGNPRVCIIDVQAMQSAPGRGFIFDSGEGPASRLAGITIKGGYVDSGYGGAGILCKDKSDGTPSSPTITNCIITGCQTEYGLDGAGILCMAGAAPIITGCIIVFNGGNGNGGGIYCEEASPQIIGNTINDNGARDGGGIYCHNASPTITDNTITGNRGYVTGATGGVSCNFGSSPALANNIIVFSADGSAVSCDGTSSATLSCCDLYGNEGGDWVGAIAGQFGSNGNIAADPLFCDADGPDNDPGTVDDDFTLRDDSPCRPAADPLCGLIGAWPVACEPEIYVVDPGGGGDFTTIQAAIDASRDRDVIELADVTFTGDGNRDLDYLGKAITIRSQSRNPAACIIDPEGSESSPHRGFYFHNGEGIGSVLEGVTITGGYTSTGGGIYCNGSSPTIRNCIFTDNESTSSSGAGGGICNTAGSPWIVECIFTNNRAANAGGAMRNGGGGTPKIEDCVFTGNWAQYAAGGIYNYGSSPKVTRCTFTGNTSDNWGGAVHNQESAPVLRDCTFTQNQALHGGGVYNRGGAVPMLVGCVFLGNIATTGLGGGMYSKDSSDPTVINCLFAGNAAGDDGGGMFNNNGCQATLTNCVFSGNSANDKAGGLYCRSSDDSTVVNCTFYGNSAAYGGGMFVWDQSTPILTNCIFRDNTATNGPQIGVENNSTASITYSNVEGGLSAIYLASGGIVTWGSGNIDADPLFSDPDGGDNTVGTADDDMRLQFRSPCIDAGNNTAILPDTGDLDGDGNTSEPTPLDLDRRARFFDDLATEDTGYTNGDLPVVDMGAFEYDVLAVFVDAGASGNDDGTSWTDAYHYLQDALVTAQAAATTGGGAKVFVAEGIYRPHQGGTPPADPRDATFALINGVALYGGFPSGGGSWEDRDPASHVTVLSGDLNGNDKDREDPRYFYDTFEPTRSENSYHVITANNNDTSAVLDGVTVGHGQASASGWESCGGGIFMTGSCATVTNCILSDNYALNYGGGMHNQNGSSPFLTGCLFKHNGTGSGGAGLHNANVSSPVIMQCEFTENVATNYGGGIYNRQSSPTVTHCTMYENTAGWDGGVVFNTDSSLPTIANCTIINNQAGSSYHGGGIQNDSDAGCLVTHSILWGNAPDQIDGGSITLTCSDIDQTGYSGSNGNIRQDPIFCHPLNDDYTLHSYSPCSEAHSACGRMGAWPVACEPSVYTVKPWPDTTGDFPTIQEAIDAAVFDDVIELTDGVFTGEGNGMVNFLGKAITVRSQSGNPEDCVIDCEGHLPGFTFNHGEGSDSVLSGITIRNASSGCGTINCTSSSPTIENCILVDNMKSSGGGICCEDSASPTITDCTIKRNSAFTGGGIYCENSSSPQISSCEISLNTAYNDGGGICCISESSPTIIDSFINNNNVIGNQDLVGHGGGIFCANSSPQIYDSTVSGNHAKLNGGGIFCTSESSPRITGCTIDGNEGTGGGIYCGDNSSPEISACVITNNISRDMLLGDAGGGIYCHAGSTPTVTDCTIQGNSADQGGGIYNAAYVEISRCTITQNGADAGGGIFTYSGESSPFPDINDCTISHNWANYGGGIYCGYSSPKVEYCRITDNSADFNGGGVCAVGGSSPIFRNSLLKGNRAGAGHGNGTGGAIHCQGESYLQVINCTVMDNTSATGGDGLFCTNSTPTITNSIFWKDDAGQIDTNGCSPEISYSNIRGCGGSGASWDVSLGNDGGGNIDADPLVVPDYHLQAGSPCRNAGDPNSIPPAYPGNDLDGETRPFEGAYDMGADEFWDTDGDDLPDHWEWDWFKNLDQTATTDKDNDGLSDLDEFIHGTDPTDPDTDDDGVSDRYEVDAGTDPNDPNDFPSMPDYYVAPPPLGDDVNNNGVNPDSPFATIQHAIDVAKATQTNPAVIHVAGGTYTETVVMEAWESIEGGWNSAFTERWDFEQDGLSPDSGYETIIDGEGLNRCIDVSELDDEVLHIDGFTIRNGSAILGGGILLHNASPEILHCIITENTAQFGGGIGVSCSSSRPILSRCIISNNTATDESGLGEASGGGIYIAGSFLRITDCRITGNQTNGSGGGMHAQEGSTPIIRDSELLNNMADDGGAISVSGASLTLERSTLSGNGAGSHGGALSITDDSSATVNACILDNNGGGAGGGMWFHDSSAVVTNTLFIGNNSSIDGGAIFNDTDKTLPPPISSLFLTNCTLAGNNAFEGYDGGGLYCRNLNWSVVTNCILWDNDGGAISSFGNSVIDVTYSDVQGGYEGETNIDADPGFVGGGDYRLNPGSPCIDAGTSNNAPVFDLDGNLRYDDPNAEPNTGGGTYTYYDMGSYEYVPPCQGDFDNDGDVDGSDLAQLANDPTQLDLGVFAANVGRTDCSD